MSGDYAFGGITLLNRDGGGATGSTPQTHRAGNGSAGGEGSRSAQILIVDDEPNVASFMARALQAKGFSVDIARDGREGLDRAMSRSYELVVLDLRMPDVNGVTVLKEFRRDRPHQRVMVVSAAAGVEVKVRCLELGAVDFLAKPFELAELTARVAARVGAPTSESDPSERYLRVGSLTLDLYRHAVDTGSDAGFVPLSSREFDLLRFLMTRAGRPCSREQLLDAVWDTSFETGTNVVDVYVHRLRHKLGGGQIETLRNVGYLLEPV